MSSVTSGQAWPQLVGSVSRGHRDFSLIFPIQRHVSYLVCKGCITSARPLSAGLRRPNGLSRRWRSMEGEKMGNQNELRKPGPIHLLLFGKFSSCSSIRAREHPHSGPITTTLHAFTPVIGGVINFQHTQPYLQTLFQTQRQFLFELPRVFYLHLPPN